MNTPKTPQVDFYIPERYDEGYGVSYKGIDWASENGFKLIITLDCGIKANEKVEYARERGIDMIMAIVMMLTMMAVRTIEQKNQGGKEED